MKSKSKPQRSKSKRLPSSLVNRKQISIFVGGLIVLSIFAHNLYHADDYAQAFFLLGKIFYFLLELLFAWYCYQGIKQAQ